MQGIPCQPPCWEGITPGVTTAEEAAEILEGSSLVQQVETSTIAIMSETGFIEWEWAGGDAGGWANYDAETSSHTIYRVFPYLDKSLTLGEVIQSYGEPTHVKTWDSCGEEPGSGRYRELGLVYLSQGFWLYDHAGGGLAEPTIEPTMRIEEVQFFDVQQSDNVDAVPFNVDELVQWQGFKDFHEYSGAPEEYTCP